MNLNLLTLRTTFEHLKLLLNNDDLDKCTLFCINKDDFFFGNV